jgi:hypothetical protein
MGPLSGPISLRRLITCPISGRRLRVGGACLFLACVSTLPVLSPKGTRRLPSSHVRQPTEPALARAVTCSSAAHSDAFACRSPEVAFAAWCWPRARVCSTTAASSRRTAHTQTPAARGARPLLNIGVPSCPSVAGSHGRRETWRATKTCSSTLSRLRAVESPVADHHRDPVARGDSRFTKPKVTRSNPVGRASEAPLRRGSCLECVRRDYRITRVKDVFQSGPLGAWPG